MRQPPNRHRPLLPVGLVVILTLAAGGLLVANMAWPLTLLGGALFLLVPTSIFWRIVPTWSTRRDLPAAASNMSKRIEATSDTEDRTVDALERGQRRQAEEIARLRERVAVLEQERVIEPPLTRRG